MRPPRSEFHKAFQDEEVWFDSLGNPENLNKLAEDIRQQPKKYINLKIF